MDKIKNMDKIKMFNGNILALPVNEEKKESFFMPDEKSYKLLKVIKSSSEDVKYGDIIYVHKNKGTGVNIEGNDYVVVNIHDVILCK